jgi:thiosulfate/3-mercaptopyruvate sulfurtransferase
LGKSAQTVIDARAGARYRGEVEPLDPVAGHIPGAINRPFTENFTEDGRFKPADVLKAEWRQVLAGRPASSVVHHCGSGVTAVPNLIAMELAGFGATALYAGSWSEWCRTPGLPCAKG